METIFFAYEGCERSKTSVNVDAIKRAQEKLSSNNNYRIQTWEDLLISGRVLIETICEAIDECDIFACDLTFFNSNVFFELGYAIAKEKKLLLLINEKLETKRLYYQIDILKTVGYCDFANADDIILALNKIHPDATLKDDLSISSKVITHNLLYINSGSNSQAELDVINFLQKTNYSLIIDDPSEVEYRIFKWYIESIHTSQSVIVHINDSLMSQAQLNNIKASLFAGISVGFSKKTVLLAPKGYEAPMDYADILISYESADDSIKRLQIWLDRNQQLPITQDKKDREYNLLKLGLGYETAENERDVLSEYFVETSAYNDALDSKRAFFIGRKGTGKTALYIILYEEFSIDKKTFVVDLKPESSELLDNANKCNKLIEVAKKHSFFYSIWRFIIYSKTIILIANSIDKTKYPNFSNDAIEKQIVDFYEKHSSVLEKQFFEIFESIVSKNDEKTLKIFHENYITPLNYLIKRYIKENKYTNIKIIADNLDKTWSIENDLDVQVDMILSLVEVTSKIEKELKEDINQRIDISTLFFLREDIFEYILKKSREPDKLILYKKEMDWSNFPDKLKLLLEERFRYSLELKPGKDVEYIWKEYFNLSKTKTPQDIFDSILSICLPRPRDLLVFVGYLFTSAVNNSHNKVEDMDFEYAIKGYSKFLYQNITVELKTKYPDIQNILDELHVKYEDMIEYEKFRDALHILVNSKDYAQNLIDDFIETGYITIFNINSGEKYSKYKVIEKDLESSLVSFWLIKLKPQSPNIYVKLGPGYNRKISQKEELDNKNKRGFFSRIVK